jgi:CheY-like chemotaxis protein
MAADAAGETMPPSLAVLLVDDHAGVVNALVRQFRRHPWLHVVASAGNGQEALRAVRLLAPDVVLMDLAMPGMDGLQATRLIKSLPDPPRVILASHFDDAVHREYARQAGADAFVGKLDYLQEVLPLLAGFARMPAGAAQPPP